MSANTKRLLLFAVVGAAVVAAVVYGLQPKPVLVEAATAERGPLRLTVDEEGKTRIRENYIVYAPVTGQSRRLPFDVGDAIQQGQVVAHIDPALPVPLDPRTRAQAEAELAAARMRLQPIDERIRSAQANLEYWRTENDRVLKLSRTGDIAASRLDQTRLQLEQAEAAVAEAQKTLESTRAEVRRAEAVLQEYQRPQQAAGQPVIVRAPTSGRVLRMMRESGGSIQAGEPLLEIGNSRALEIEVEVLSPDAVKIAPGTRVILTRWGGDKPLEGTVQRLEPAGFTKVSALGVEEQRVRVIAILTSPESEWKRLGAGYRVEASFVLWESDKALRVPTSALFRKGGDWSVFVVENGVAKARPVQLGHQAGLLTEITQGLQPGDLLVAHPDDTIQDGTNVEVRK
jgi:HlyD family secretion protein